MSVCVLDPTGARAFRRQWQGQLPGGRVMMVEARIQAETGFMLKVRVRTELYLR